MGRLCLFFCVPTFIRFPSFNMSAPNPNSLYYVAYPPSNPWTYDYSQAHDYLQFPAPCDFFVDPAITFNDGIDGATQPLPASDDFFSTMAPEPHSNENHHALSRRCSEDG